jgi:hypothetical protein
MYEYGERELLTILECISEVAMQRYLGTSALELGDCGDPEIEREQSPYMKTPDDAAWGVGHLGVRLYYNKAFGANREKICVVCLILLSNIRQDDCSHFNHVSLAPSAAGTCLWQ